jgi:hypothetical protein
MLGFVDLTRKGAGGIITAERQPNFVKHDFIYLKCGNSTGFINGMDNQRSRIIATIPIGTSANWGAAFEYEPTSFNWSLLDTQSPVFEFVDKWDYPVKNIGEFFLQFIMN